MLVKSVIKAEVKTAFEQVMNDQGDRNEALDKVANKLADAVVNAIKSIEITYVAGLTSPTGAVTGTFQCTIK